MHGEGVVGHGDPGGNRQSPGRQPAAGDGMRIDEVNHIRPSCGGETGAPDRERITTGSRQRQHGKAFMAYSLRNTPAAAHHEPAHVPSVPQTLGQQPRLLLGTTPNSCCREKRNRQRPRAVISNRIASLRIRKNPEPAAESEPRCPSP